MKVPLSLSVVDNPSFLQEVGTNVSPLCIESMVVPDVHVLSLHYREMGGGREGGSEGGREGGREGVSE